MTARSGPPDETELHAYADGHLPAERIAAVEGWLAEDAEARARLASWRQQNELIFRLYDSAVDPSTSAWLSHRLRQRAAVGASRGRRPGRLGRGRRRRLAGPRALGTCTEPMASLPVRPSTSSKCLRAAICRARSFRQCRTWRPSFLRPWLIPC